MVGILLICLWTLALKLMEVNNGNEPDSMEKIENQSNPNSLKK